jgi:hypothetical protein
MREMPARDPGDKMRSIAFATTLTLFGSGTCLAGEGLPCEKIEYAKLKDSTKKELTDEYCRATARGKLNEDLGKISTDFYNKQIALGANTTATRKAISERGDAQVSCMGVAEDVAAMLKKKYKAAPPSCASK